MIGRPAAAFAAAAILCACRGEANVPDAAPTPAGETAAAMPMQASPPPAIWNGATRLNILCIVTGTADAEALRADFCARVRAAAIRGAPLPVETIGAGDPAAIDPNAVTLLVHAAVNGEGAERLLAFSLRPYRNGGADTDILFGAAPRAVRLPQAGTAPPALEEALAASLAEALPWLARPSGARRIS